MARVLSGPPSGSARVLSGPGAAPAPSKAPAAPKLGDGAAGEFAGNAVRAVASPLFRLGGSIEGALGMKEGAASAKKTADNLDAGADQTLPGKAGTAVGVVAPYLTGAGEEEGAAVGAKVLAKTGSRVAGYVASRAPAFAANTAVGTAQTGSLKKGAEAAVVNEVAAPVLKAVKGTIAPTAERVAVKAMGHAEGRIAKIHDLISPKLTAKETKLALAQGRIVPGQEPGLLRGGTPDQVLPSKDTERAAQTIVRHLPDAHSMKAPDLYSALDSKVGEIATKLKPEMQNVPVSERTVTKITSDWDALKAKQLADPYMDATANVEKLQAQFETNFLQKSKSGNLNDLWETRKAYDASVPANVKDATSLSSDKLQTQKSIWLQNREILNGAINDSASGLGHTSQRAFADMSDMYNAQKGIQSSFKVAKDGAASKVEQFAKSKAGKVVGSIAAGAGAVETGKRLITGSF